ncbi:MAG: acyltransferase family protein [Candidatus Wallbacteria bacterium]|nr:acyltransferase family protein [Candidatus Wallbacteria bacterium]
MRPEETVLESPEELERLDGARGPKRSCLATTKRGKPCRVPPLADADFCPVHFRSPAPEDDQPPEDEPAAGRDGDAAGPSGRERIVSELLGEVERLVRQTLERLHGSGILTGLNILELTATLRQSLGKLLPSMQFDVLRMLKDTLQSDYLDLDTWRGLAYVVRSALEAQLEQTRERFQGKAPTDEYGLDYAFYEAVRPLVTFMYRHWFRVETTGIENVPADGPCLLVANHSGVLPWDGVMLSEAIWEHHPQPRHARLLFLKWFASIPFIAPFLAKTGQVLACPENGKRLLSQGQLVGVFPEGIKGIGKPFRERYRLARFGRGGFTKLAMQTRAPIVPVAIVGAEETYPAIYKLDFVAKLLGLPYLPITPTFPLFGLLGFVPLPTKWHIHFCKPLRFNERAPSKADDYLVVSLLTERVRNIVQLAINELLRRRRSVF